MSQAVHECPNLTEDQETAIHRAACEVAAGAVYKCPPQISDPTIADVANETVMGAFVTVKRNGQLRGCCGTLGQPMPLSAALSQSAARTVTDDRRFPPVSPSEFAHLSLDVTILFNFEPITQQGADRATAIEVGRHGLRIQRGNQSGLLLPIVAVERGWDATKFLDQVCQKAGLPITAWQQPDTNLERFEGRLIERDIDPAVLQNADAKPALPVSQREVGSLASFARSNIFALVQGAVPGCFPANVSDGTVGGIALRLTFPETVEAATFSQIQYRSGLPLQTTLLNLTQGAAQWMRNTSLTQQMVNGMAVDLILMTDPAMHGTVQDHDCTGIDPATRAVLVTDGWRSAWQFNRESTAQALVDAAAEAARVSSPESAQVLSLSAVSSAAEFGNSNVPQPKSGETVRPPGVAGQFYPSGEKALAAIVKKCLGSQPETTTWWPAAMVPHAGLQYSGEIAGGVLNQLEIPDTVIIIGPKHTRYGVEWSVAPHETWQLPGELSISSDVELARLLAERIDGLELDAAAHAHEHCIEVELPLIAQLAPETKVVGIAIGGGDLKRCIRFGQQLALVISEMEKPPLMIISSDMNHFASDEENRKLDEIALAAMETMDPKKLFEAVTTNNISMCGVLPAVIVMEALLSLDELEKTERTGYATSADVSGDTSRVVGYAGMLLG